MISVMPELHPDELLISVYARYKRQMGYLNDSDVWRDWFSLPNMNPKILLANDLKAMRKNIPISWLPDLSVLVKNHTCIPYLSLFYPDNQKQDWIDIDRGKLKFPAGLNLMERAKRMDGLSYCPECARSDEELFGEPYWHRAHNLPGVFVCYRHKAILESLSTVETHSSKTLVLPPFATDLPEPQYVDEDDINNLFLIFLAEDAYNLLAHCERPNAREVLAQAIMSEVRALGMTYKLVRASANQVNSLLVSTFSKEVLQFLDFPPPQRLGVSWCQSFTGMHTNFGTSAGIIALFSLGRRVKNVFDSESSNLSKEKEQFAISGREKVCPKNELPIEALLGMRVSERIDFPDFLKKKIERVIAFSRRTRTLRDNLYIEHVGEPEQREWLVYLKETVEMMKTSQAKITKHGIAIGLGIDHQKIKLIMKENDGFRDEVLASIESPIDYAKRKATIAYDRLKHEASDPTAWDVVKESNTHKHYGALKIFIESLLNN